MIQEKIDKFDNDHNNQNKNLKHLEDELKKKSLESFEDLELSVKKFIEKFQHKTLLSHNKLIKMLSFVIPKITNSDTNKINSYLKSIEYDAYCDDMFYNKDFEMQKIIENYLKDYLDKFNEVEISHKINQAKKLIKNEFENFFEEQIIEKQRKILLLKIKNLSISQDQIISNTMQIRLVKNQKQFVIQDVIKSSSDYQQEIASKNCRETLKLLISSNQENSLEVKDFTIIQLHETSIKNLSEVSKTKLKNEKVKKIIILRLNNTFTASDIIDCQTFFDNPKYSIPNSEGCFKLGLKNPFQQFNRYHVNQYDLVYELILDGYLKSYGIKLCII